MIKSTYARITFLAVIFSLVIAPAILLASAELEGEAAELAASFGEGTLLTFFGIFLIGLALNLTPCVYPMLAVTVSIFGGQSETNSLKVFFRALLYVLGIATMYSVLGVFAALTGGLFGAILQSRFVLVAISILFFALSLSMFGLYELRPPSSVMNKLGGQRSAGYLGIYLSGLFVGIFAAPCVGPPVIGLLTLVGHYADPFFGFAAFFVLSLGLGLPYLILGTFAGLLKKLPKSGAWMNWVKKLMGIVLIAVGCFYLSLAYDPQLAFVLIPLTLLIGGIYLGFVESSQGRSKLFPWLKRLVGIVAVVAAMLIYQSGQVPSISWQNYEPAKMVEGTPTVIYFSASWCIPCLEIDRRTYTVPEVINSFAPFTRLKVDLSHYDSPESTALREKYRISGVPTILFLDSQGNEIRSRRVVGFVDADELIARVNYVLDADKSGELKEEDYLAQEEESGPYSHATLIADVNSIQPGVAFKIGLLFEMEEEWYVYWKNPGDSGEPPRLDWTLPEGFSMAEVQWPVPERFDAAPFATFGHSEELLLYYEITPPTDLDDGEMSKFSVDAEWLVCKKICISQNGSFELDIPVSLSQPEPSDSLLHFDRASSMLPLVAEDWKFSARAERRALFLQVIPPEGTTDEMVLASSFYPEMEGVVRAGSFSWRKVNDGFELSMVRTGLPHPEKLHGVLVLPDGSDNSFLVVEADF